MRGFRGGWTAITLLVVASMVVALDPTEAAGQGAGVAARSGSSTVARSVSVRDLPARRSTDRPSDLPSMPTGERPPATNPDVVSTTPVQFVDPSPAIEPRTPPSEYREFKALGDTGWIPPDTNGGVGPNHVMTALNGGVLVQDRSGTAIGSEVDLSDWFGRSTENDVFDPVIVYDPHHDRWIFVACASSHDADSVLMIAISDTHDPSENFKVWTVDVDTDGADGLWADRPFVGLNDRWITVSLNMYDIAGGASNADRPQIYVFPLDEAYDSDSTLDWLWWDTTLGGTDYNTGMVPAVSYDDGVTASYLFGLWNANAGSVKLWTITGTAYSPVIDAGTLIDTAGSWEHVGGEIGVQLGTTDLVDVGDSRMQKVILRDGDLWAVQSVMLPVGTPDHSEIQLWHLETNGTVDTQVVIGSSGVSRAYPSIAVNDLGHILIGYARFSSDRYAHAAYVYSTDESSWSQTERIFKGGANTYQRTGSGSLNRWGDYTATVVDPLNDLDLWTIGEWATSTVNTWSTWWAMVHEGPDGDELVDGRAVPDWFASGYFGFTESTDGSGPRYGQATDEPLSCGDSEFARTLWHTFTPAGDMRVNVFVSSADFDTELAVYTGSNERALTQVTCNDDANETTLSSLSFDAEGGTTYRVQLGGWHGATGSAEVMFEAVEPANDDFADATSVDALPYDVTQVTGGSTTQSGEPLACADASIGRTVWFSYTPSRDGAVEISTVGSEFDTVVGVYTGSAVDALAQVGCNDDAVGNKAAVTAFLTAGTTYHVQVGGYEDGPGSAAYGGLTLSMAIPEAYCDGVLASIVGTDAGETIHGTPGVDVIVGLKGRDEIYGHGGDDLICSGSGSDTVYGGDGGDVVFGGKKKDKLIGGPGPDLLVGQGGGDKLNGKGGDDQLFGGPGGDTLLGKGGDDYLDGGSGHNALDGGPGSSDTCVNGDTYVHCEL